MAADHEVANHRIVETERAREFFKRFGVHFHIHQDVVRLVDLRNGIGELASAPVFHSMYGAAPAFDHGAVALHHSAHLFGLVRVHHEDYFVVSHFNSSSRVRRRVPNRVRRGWTGGFYWRARTTSNSRMPAATATFRLDTAPAMGMRTR